MQHRVAGARRSTENETDADYHGGWELSRRMLKSPSAVEPGEGSRFSGNLEVALTFLALVVAFHGCGFF
jgi:hypothetical protein